MPYSPIEDYAVIGNLHTIALVNLSGSIDFLCLPRFDAPSVFAQILDDKIGGCFSITCLDDRVRNNQIYLPNTNILLTRYSTAEGIAELTDFMPVVDLEEDFAIHRRLKACYGSHRFRVILNPRFDYARQGCLIEKAANDEGYLFHDPTGSQASLKLTTTQQIDFEIVEDQLLATVDLSQGEHIDFVFFLLEGNVRQEPFSDALHACRKYWEAWSAKCTYTGQWKESVLRSVLALKLLTSKRYGSVVAAGTFGLPETIGGERNWDYRYTWIRDSAFTMYAFLRLGYRDEAEAFIAWIKDKCMDGLQLMYGIDGRKELTEKNLDHLEGYRKSQPVRIGNGAYDQTQMDIFGELIDTVYLYNEAGGSITQDFWVSIAKIVEYVIANWKTKDHGIWEVRSGKQRFLHSAVCCWVAVDRAMRIGEDRSLAYPRTEWRSARDKMYHDIYENFYSEEIKAYPQFLGSDTVDASALLMPLLRFVSSREPRWLETFSQIEEKLCADVLVFRYKQEHGATDGLKGEESSFTICSFWYAECLARIGRNDEAIVAMEKLLSYGNHVGLFSEEISVHGEQLGNFPQAFSHLALISAAFQIEKRRIT